MKQLIFEHVCMYAYNMIRMYVCIYMYIHICIPYWLVLFLISYGIILFTIISKNIVLIAPLQGLLMTTKNKYS